MLSVTAEDKMMSQFKIALPSGSEERRVISEIFRFHLSVKGSVKKKDIILSLILLLETEQDAELLETYRSALQKVAGQSEDDM